MRRKVKLLVGVSLLAGVCIWSTYRPGLFHRASATPVSQVISASSQSSGGDPYHAASVATTGKPESSADKTSTAIALRYDNTHVFFPAADFEDFNWDRAGKLRDLGSTAAKYGPEGLWAADAELLRDHHELFDRAQRGEEWQLEISTNSRIAVIIREPVIAEVVGNTMTGFLAEVTPPDRAKFSSSPNQYFLIHRMPGGSDQRPRQEMSHVGELPNWKATSEQRAQIEHLLNSRMKTELAAMNEFAYRDEAAASKYPEFKVEYAMWRRFDRALASGQAKLDYDTQAFQLTPDGAPRLFIRARWMIDRKPAFLMTAWVRIQPNPIIEAADSGPSKVLRTIGGYEPDLETLGIVLNVLDRDSDGYGEVLIFYGEYEGFTIQLLRYTDAGPVDTGIFFGGSA